MKKEFILFIIASFITVTTFAQQPGVTIAGKVTDETNSPQPFANVSLHISKDTSIVKTSITDTSGRYVFDQVKTGDYLITTTMVGYNKTYSKPIHIDNTSNSIVKAEVLKLATSSTSLQEVSIVAKTAYIEQQAGKTIVNVENSILATDGTALDVLSKSPGVTVDKDGNVSLKGKAGVNIMIDGKSTYLSQEELSTMLKSMPSNTIEKIELITNPSAKYDASGNSGVINIKTKRNKKAGFNGSINTGITKGLHYRYNSGANLGYRDKNYNVFGNYNFSDNTREMSLILKRKIDYNNVYNLFDQKHGSIRHNEQHNYKAGFDYYINNKNTIGIMASGYNEQGNDNGQNITGIKNRFNEVDSSLSVVNHMKNKYSNLVLNLNYKLAIDTTGKELTADADYAHYNTMSNNDIINTFYNKTGNTSGDELFYKSSTPSIVDVKSIKADYTHPVNATTKFEAGFKSSLVTTDNDVKFNILTHEQWLADPLRTNHFIYRENINAAYVNFSKDLSKTTLQLGLRAEQTHSNGNSVTVQKVVDTTYLQLFPSLSLSQKLSEKNQLAFSYSRRIDRPTYRDLNPFIYYLDPYSYAQGNPYLRPQLTNKVELSHTYNGSITTALGYSRTRDVAVQVTEQDDVTKITRAVRKNLQTLNSVDLSVNASIPVTPWWMFVNTVSVYYNQYRSEISGGSLNVHSYSFSINSNSSFTLPNNFSIELTGFYDSPGVYGMINYRRQCGVDAGVQKSFFDKKLVLKLGITDMFATNFFIGTVNYQNMDIYIKEYHDNRAVKFSAVYKFGNSSIKPNKRKSGAEEEMNRVRNN